MSFDFLSPVQDSVLTHSSALTNQTLGKVIKIHSQDNGIPNLNNVNIAIVGVLETRNAIDYTNDIFELNRIRKAFYKLFPGNWHTSIADLGDIQKGKTIEDTYFALRTLLTTLLKKDIIPIILGGSQDLTYANYRAYDTVMPMVNLVNVDSNFDLGDATASLKNNRFLGKIILEEPYNLFNYTTIGYQTYFNAQEEIDLMDKLYFEAYRLGEIVENINKVEPLMRDANIVSLDLKSIRSSELSEAQKHSPNGFDGKEICAISRYAGISNKVSSFGIYEYKPSKEKDNETTMLIAQIMWYFIEGVNCRINDDDFEKNIDHKKFTVLLDDQELIFYKSIKTERWWVEIPFLLKVNNKLKRKALLPCTHEDYIGANNGVIPKRWYKAYQKNSV